MMEEAIITRLRSDAGMIAATATFDSRPAVDWIERPSDASLPGVTLQAFSTRSYVHAGPTDLQPTTIQFDCWGGTYGETKVMERAIIAIMETSETVASVFFDKAFLDTSVDIEPEDIGSGIKVFRTRMDWSLWTRPV